MKLSGNHLFRCSARVVLVECREKRENHPWRWFLHVGVEGIVAAQSTLHRPQIDVVAEPRLKTNHCSVSGLNIECDWE